MIAWRVAATTPSHLPRRAHLLELLGPQRADLGRRERLQSRLGRTSACRDGSRLDEGVDASLVRQLDDRRILRTRSPYRGARLRLNVRTRLPGMSADGVHLSSSTAKDPAALPTGASLVTWERLNIEDHFKLSIIDDEIDPQVEIRPVLLCPHLTQDDRNPIVHLRLGDRTGAPTSLADSRRGTSGKQERQRPLMSPSVTCSPTSRSIAESCSFSSLLPLAVQWSHWLARRRRSCGPPIEQQRRRPHRPRPGGLHEPPRRKLLQVRVPARSPVARRLVDRRPLDRPDRPRGQPPSRTLARHEPVGEERFAAREGFVVVAESDTWAKAPGTSDHVRLRGQRRPPEWKWAREMPVIPAAGQWNEVCVTRSRGRGCSPGQHERRPAMRITAEC
jgi:hypothetical protein